MKSTSDQSRYVLCISDRGDALSVMPGRFYKVVEPELHDAPTDLRVIDEEGEDYLYPSAWFTAIDLPDSVIEQLEHVCSKPLPPPAGVAVGVVVRKIGYGLLALSLGVAAAAIGWRLVEEDAALMSGAGWSVVAAVPIALGAGVYLIWRTDAARMGWRGDRSLPSLEMSFDRRPIASGPERQVKLPEGG